MKRKNPNYRFYSFTNMYLSSIQKGIQTAHVMAQLFIESPQDFSDWARSAEPTIIVLNGGHSYEIVDLYYKLYNTFDYHRYGGVKENELLPTIPVSIFYESDAALASAATAVGLIIPESVWNPKIKRRTKLEKAIYSIISKYSLAI
jgi:hypothetical protein